MQKQRVWLLCLALLIVGNSPAIPAAQPPSPPAPQQLDTTQPGSYEFVSGRIVEIHAPHVFTVRDDAGGRELLVVTQRPLSPGFVGGTVTVGGVLRRFSSAELRRTGSLAGVDERTRQRLAGGPLLLASSVMAVAPGELPGTVLERPRLQPFQRREPPAPVHRRLAEAQGEPRPQAPLSMRLAMLAANVDEFAGQPVRALHGRVVGVLEPAAFLIEPATGYLKPMGQRDRVLVLIEAASLRVPAELVVGSTVTVTGVARTLVSMQMTREVPWPPQLRPEEVDRLEVRGALLARSVQTAEGTELTGRPPAPAR